MMVSIEYGTIFPDGFHRQGFVCVSAVLGPRGLF